MDITSYLDALIAFSDQERATKMLASHKVPRRYLGLANHQVNTLTTQWRQDLDLSERVALADGLWQTDIFEARFAASKLLTQARIKQDDAVWQLILFWAPDFDSPVLIDHACSAGGRRIMANLARLEDVEAWTVSENVWEKRAALVITSPLGKLPFPKPHEVEARERVLSWAADYVTEPEWPIQDAVAVWIRDMSKHDATRAQTFIDEYGTQLKPFALNEAIKHLN